MLTPELELEPIERHKSITSWYPDALLLGPGGIRGFLELGSLLYLEYAEMSGQVKEVVGVSIGAIIGLLWVLGYHPLEIARECLNFSLLNGTTIFEINVLDQLSRIGEKWGAIDIRVLESRLNYLAKEKYGLVPNLIQLRNVSGCNFICVATNVTDEKPVAFCAESHPTLSSVTAVLMSSNIPGIMECIEFNGKLHADGALRNPYPIELVDHGQRVLAIYIYNKIDFKKANNDNPFAAFQFLSHAYSSSINELYKRSRSTASDNCRHLELPAVTMDTIGLTVSNETKIAMLVTGFIHTRKFVQQHCHP